MAIEVHKTHVISRLSGEIETLFDGLSEVIHEPPCWSVGWVHWESSIHLHDIITPVKIDIVNQNLSLIHTLLVRKVRVNRNLGKFVRESVVAEALINSCRILYSERRRSAFVIVTQISSLVGWESGSLRRTAWRVEAHQFTVSTLVSPRNSCCLYCNLRRHESRA